LRDKDGFVGDKASRRSFRETLLDWRMRLDPIGEDDKEIRKKKLDILIGVVSVEAESESFPL
jgi:hypothetical protein